MDRWRQKDGKTSREEEKRSREKIRWMGWSFTPNLRHCTNQKNMLYDHFNGLGRKIGPVCVCECVCVCLVGMTWLIPAVGKPLGGE